MQLGNMPSLRSILLLALPLASTGFAQPADFQALVHDVPSESLRAALDKPLASYYLLLGSSALLLTIGLIMVLSASSVRSYLTYDDSYAVVKRQLLWVAIGLPAAWVASRMPIKHVRRLAYPGFVFALVLLALVARFGVLINGNKNWLAVGPVLIQPAEIAKLALILWAAHIYAHKDRRLDSLHHIMMPVVPGLLGATLLVVVGLLCSAITVFVYVRVIVLMYFTESNSVGVAVVTPSALTMITVAFGALLTLVLGVAPASVLEIAGRASQFIR